MQIDRELAQKVLHVVDQGLVRGLGEPIPGQMCVEAAVCYAMGLPHSAEPTCVDEDLCALKIILNDAPAWESPASRAAGMRRLAIAQLGSAGVLDANEFAKRVTEAAKRCREEGTRGAISAAKAVASSACDAYTSYAGAVAVAYESFYAQMTARYSARYATNVACAAANIGGERVLVDFAERVVQILISMNAPGCKFLDLTE